MQIGTFLFGVIKMSQNQLMLIIVHNSTNFTKLYKFHRFLLKIIELYTFKRVNFMYVIFTSIKPFKH